MIVDPVWMIGQQPGGASSCPPIVKPGKSGSRPCLGRLDLGGRL